MGGLCAIVGIVSIIVGVIHLLGLEIAAFAQNLTIGIAFIGFGKLLEYAKNYYKELTTIRQDVQDIANAMEKEETRIEKL